MFFAAAQIREEPELADKPLAIGDNSMISTANYVARQWGVRSAMPGFIAKHLCPQLVFRPINGKLYKEISAIFKGILREYDPYLESMGSDEANLDVTDYLKSHPEHSPESLAQEMRRRINEDTRLTCSAGIASNKMLAKICSDFNKPNGQTYLEPNRDKIVEFMAKLPLRKVPGIGRMSELTFKELGIETCADVLEQAHELYIAYEKFIDSYSFFINAALGVSRTEHKSEFDEERKSMSISSTFETR